MLSQVRTRPLGLQFCPSSVALCILLSLLTILQYQFSTGHQTEQFPLILRLLDPNFIAQDFYTNSASEFGPRYYYVHMVAALASWWSLPGVILSLTLIVNFALAAITYLAARDLLGADRLSGQIAAVLAVTSTGFALGLRSYLRFEEFQPASPAIAISLLALWCGIRRRPIEAALLAGAASLFHPLIGVETGALALACAAATLLIEHRAGTRPFPMQEAATWSAGALVLAFLTYTLWIAPLPPPGRAPLTAQEFYEILAVFRAPHHYLPSAMPATHYATFLAYVVSLAALMLLWHRRGASSPSSSGQAYARRNTALLMLLAVLGIIVACGLSYLFVELMHSRLWITSQPFRMLYVIKWIGVLFIAWWASRLLQGRDPVEVGMAALALLSTAQAQPNVLLLCLGAWFALRSAGTEVSTPWRWSILGVLTVVAGLLNWKAGSASEMAMISAGLLCVYCLGRADQVRPKALIVPACVIAGLILLAWWNRSEQWLDLEAFKPSFTVAGLEGPAAEIAGWAQRSTPPDSIWLVPPEFQAFRVLAERAVVADFISLPFSDAGMRAWKERMTTSYGEVDVAGFAALVEMQHNHRHLTPERAFEVSRRFGASYAVLYRSTEWPGEVLYANEAFKAVKLPGPAGASVRAETATLAAGRWQGRSGG